MSIVIYGGVCEQGPVRPNNEDFILSFVPDDPAVHAQKGSLFVVADGVGGSRAGEVASREAATQLRHRYYGHGKQAQRALQEAFKQVNLHVVDMGLANPEYRRMETTLSALVLLGDHALIGHVGDSRIYRLRGGVCQQLTNDHSEVGELVRMQLISEEDARHHPRRNVITRSIGNDLLVKADFRVEPLQVDDTFVLCTDGVWEPVGNEDIAAIVQAFEPEDACRRLIDLAIERETCDNVSVQVIKVLGWNERMEIGARGKNGLIQRAFRFLGKEEQDNQRG